MSLSNERLESIREWMEGEGQEKVMDMLTHPTTRTFIMVVELKSGTYPNLAITTNCEAGRFIHEFCGIGYAQDGGWVRINGNRLVPMMFEVIGATPEPD